MKRQYDALRKCWSFLGYSLCLLAVLCACSDEETPTEVLINENSEVYFESSMEFPSEGGVNEISFTTNKEWSITPSQAGGDVSWCSISLSNGTAGTYTVKITAMENMGYDDRNVTLILTVADVTKKVVVTQKQKDALTLTASKYNVDVTGGNINVEVKSNVNYQVEIPEPYQEWIHQKSSTTRSLTSTNLSFTIDPSQEYDKREGEILIQSGELFEIVKVYQAGSAIILLTQDEYPVSDQGGQIVVELNSNFEYEVKMPQVDWVKMVDTRSVSSHTLYYEVSPNTTYDSREAKIVYYDKNNATAADTLHIIQAQKDAIIISKKEFEVDCNENYVEVNVNANVDYDVDLSDCNSDVFLVDYPETKALETSSFHLKVAANNSNDLKIFRVIVRDANKGNVADTLMIKQAPAAYLELIQKNYDVTYEKSQITILANSSSELELEFSDNWLHTLATEKRDSYEVQVEIDENSTPYLRSGQIIVKLRDIEGVQDTVTVNQENGYLSLSVTPGTLGSLVANYGVDKIDKLRLTGSLNGQDYLYLRELSTLKCLDMEGITDKTMPANIFMGVKNLETIILPFQLEEIPASAFQNSGLTCELTIPTTVKTIGAHAFDNARITGRLILPNGLKDIREYSFVFAGISGDLIIPNSVTNIGQSAFLGCSNLSGKLIINSSGSIGSNAFKSANSEQIWIGDNVRSIGWAIFNFCEKCKLLVLGENLNYISDAAFKSMISLEKVYCKNPQPPTIQGSIFEGTFPSYLGVPIGTKSLYEASDFGKNFLVIEEVDFSTLTYD